MKDRDRYLKIVEWSEEDKCYVGSVPGWIGACCHGDNEEKVFHKLCRIVDDWIEIYKKMASHYLLQLSAKNIRASFNSELEVIFIKL